LFVDRAFAGLQKVGEVDMNDVEKKLAKEHVEVIEDISK
jgi:hypothetical protein